MTWFSILLFLLAAADDELIRRLVFTRLGALGALGCISGNTELACSLIIQFLFEMFNSAFLATLDTRFAPKVGPRSR